jgi:hypothetical protein
VAVQFNQLLRWISHALFHSGAGIFVHNTDMIVLIIKASLPKRMAAPELPLTRAAAIVAA